MPSWKPVLLATCLVCLAGTFVLEPRGSFPAGTPFVATPAWAQPESAVHSEDTDNPVAPAGASPPAGRTREALLAAWERAQLEEPNVEILEEVDAGLYRFKTTWFPFDGELRVLNVSIDQRESFNEYDYPTGVVEVELVDMPEDFWQKHSYSMGLWMQTNSLFYDIANETWLTNREWQAQLNEGLPGLPYGYGGLVKWANYLWLAVPVLLIVLLFSVMRKTQRQMNKAMTAQDEAIAGQRKALAQASEAIVLSQSANRLLEEILEELKRAS